MVMEKVLTLFPNIAKIYLVYNAYDSWLKLSLKVLNLTAMLSAFFYE